MSSIKKGLINQLIGMQPDKTSNTMATGHIHKAQLYWSAKLHYLRTIGIPGYPMLQQSHANLAWHCSHPRNMMGKS